MKRALDDLAVLGGTPAFRESLHVGRPNIGDEDSFLERVRDILERRWLTNGGPYVEEFERRIAVALGVRHCVAMCSGTVALEIAIRALGMHGEVIVPAFTFVATAHALQWQGITPVFCDVDAATHNIDPGCVEGAITSRTTGIIGVHLWGRSCDIARLETIARRRGLSLLFDAAHAFGCSHHGCMIGSFGDAEVLSFHATKFVNSFEGGAVVTNNTALADRIRLMRNFGFADLDQVVSIGTNGKMNEVAAAMGLSSLESMPDFVEKNQRNYRRYRESLAGTPGVSLMAYDPGERSNYQYVVLEINAETSGLTRDLLLQVLRAEHVMARRYFYPGCHRMEPYKSSPQSSQWRLPETERLAERVLQLPTGMAMQDSDIDRICELIRFVVRQAADLKERLASPEVSRRVGAA